MDEKIVEISAVKKEVLKCWRRQYIMELYQIILKTPVITTEMERNSLQTALLHLKEAKNCWGRDGRACFIRDQRNIGCFSCYER